MESLQRGRSLPRRARQIAQLGIAPLWTRSQGASVRVALLDTAVSSEALPQERLIALQPDGTPALPTAQSHGTFCAASIASSERGAEGVAPEACIVSIAVAHALRLTQPAAFLTCVEALQALARGAL
jgi:hypothetical protein